MPHPYAKFIGMPFNELVETCVEIGRLASFDMDLEPEYRNQCLKQFREYAHHFAGDGWLPLEIEQSFSKKLYEDENLVILYEGIVDLVADSPMGVFVGNHKQRRGALMSQTSAISSWAIAGLLIRQG